MKKIKTIKKEQITERRVAFCNQIKNIRTKKGVSSYELSRRTGIDRKNISTLENGQISPVLDTLIRVADALDCEMGFKEK